MTVPAAPALPVLDIGPFRADETSPAAAAFVDRARTGRARDRVLLRRRPRRPGRARRPGPRRRPAVLRPPGGGAAGDRERPVAAVPRATPASATSARTAASTSATRSTSAASWPNRPSGPTIRRGCACAGRTCGRPPCPSCARSRRRGWTTSRRSATSLLRALALALELPADTFADAVTPPEVLLKVIRYRTPDADADADRSAPTAARASAPTATPASCRSSTRTTSAACRSSATAG